MACDTAGVGVDPRLAAKWPAWWRGRTIRAKGPLERGPTMLRALKATCCQGIAGSGTWC